MRIEFIAVVSRHSIVPVFSWGLPIVEAMSLGLPVIVTNWTAPAGNQLHELEGISFNRIYVTRLFGDKQQLSSDH